MSVYQVEQYYIHISTDSPSDKAIETVKLELDINNIDDYEICEGYIVVDGFESEQDAANMEEIINGVFEEFAKCAH